MTSDFVREAVARAQSGDLRAFESLVEATQGMSYALARRILRDEAETRDALQEAYLRAFRRLGELDDTGAFIPCCAAS